MGFRTGFDLDRNRHLYPRDHLADYDYRGGAEVTKAQQKTVDLYHERVIGLIYKRRKAMKYGNGQKEYDEITAEIMKIEEERRKYEGDCNQSKQEERKIKRGIPEEASGGGSSTAEAGIRSED